MVGCLKNSGFMLVALKTMHMVYASLTFSLACGFSVALCLGQRCPKKMTVLLQSTGMSHSQLSPLPVWFFPCPLFLDITFALLALLSCFSTSIKRCTVLCWMPPCQGQAPPHLSPSNTSSVRYPVRSPVADLSS